LARAKKKSALPRAGLSLPKDGRVERLALLKTFEVPKIFTDGEPMLVVFVQIDVENAASDHGHAEHDS
jgi:hypothetical protein